MKQENIEIFMKWKNPKGDLKYLKITITTFLSLDFYSTSNFFYRIMHVSRLIDLGPVPR